MAGAQGEFGEGGRPSRLGQRDPCRGDGRPLPDDVGHRVDRRAVGVVRPGFGLDHGRYSKRSSGGGPWALPRKSGAGAGDDEPGPFGPIRLGGIMSDTPLAGQVAVVSGGGRGLGRSFCLALARQGAKVVVNNRNRVTDADGRGPADHVAAEILAAGGEAVAEHSDAADPAGGEAIVAAAVQRWGRLDICVANAAIGTGGMFHNQPAAQFGEVLEINLHGSVRLARAATAVMRPAGYGRIILVASTGGLHGDVGLSAYAASKGGLLAFGRSLAAEGAGKGVLTNMLLPYALTQMTDDGMPPAARARMDPDLVAPVLTALASPE